MILAGMPRHRRTAETRNNWISCPAVASQSHLRLTKKIGNGGCSSRGWEGGVQEDGRTGVEDAGEHPALGEAHGHPGAEVLQQNLHTSRPGRRGRAHGVVVAPVPNQHAVIVLGIDLREEQGPALLASLALQLALSFWAR